MITSYEELLDRLVKERVKFALAGGLAVCLNGFVRTTDDVDILVDNSPDNVTRLSRALADFGEGFGGSLTTSDLTNEPGAVRIQEDFILDIFVQMNGKTLADLSPWIGYHALKSGVQIPFLKSAALIETKKGSSREKDRADIGALTDISRAKNDKPDSLRDFNLDSVRTPPDSE
ncbi:MAG TPA: hypothetical protein VGZ93_02655 [Candidatus Methylacidiphilales bacterium]|jgi:hypothetical protein|nr:hypothetical protein [Candidatus Methylacidiphilales bacterium]